MGLRKTEAEINVTGKMKVTVEFNRLTGKIVVTGRKIKSTNKDAKLPINVGVGVVHFDE